MGSDNFRRCNLVEIGEGDLLAAPTALAFFFFSFVEFSDIGYFQKSFPSNATADRFCLEFDSLKLAGNKSVEGSSALVVE
jgi:hypothetical protein